MVKTTPEREPLIPKRPNDNAIEDQPPKAGFAWIIIAIWSVLFLSSLDGTIAATLVGSIGSEFNKAHQASTLCSSFFLSVCCFSPIYGRLSDIMDRKMTLLLGLALFGIGTTLCGLAPSMETLVIARIIAGTGGGGVLVVSNIVVTDLVSIKDRGLYHGLGNILFGVGTSLGGPIGGFVSDRWGWRWAFWFQVPIIVFSSAVIIWKGNFEGTSREKSLQARVDWLGCITLAIGIGSFLIGFDLFCLGRLPFGHPLVWGLIGTGLLGLCAFALVESRWAREPIMPRRMLTQRNPLAAFISNFLCGLAASATVSTLPMYNIAVRLRSSQHAGMHLLPLFISASIGGLFIGWLIRRTGKYWWPTVACAGLTVLSSALMATWTPYNMKEHRLWADVSPFGVGIGSISTGVSFALISSVEKSDVGVATSLATLFRTAGQVFGVSLSAGLIQTTLPVLLSAKIHGPDANEIIENIRHSLTYHQSLDQPLQNIAIESRASAIRVVFVCQAALCVLLLFTTMTLRDFNLLRPAAAKPSTKPEADRELDA